MNYQMRGAICGSRGRRPGVRRGVLAAVVAGITLPRRRGVHRQWLSGRAGHSPDGLPAGTRLRGVHARPRRSGLPRPAERRDLQQHQGRPQRPRWSPVPVGEQGLRAPGGPGDDCGAAGAAHQPGAEVRRVHARARDNEFQYSPPTAGHAGGLGAPGSQPRFAAAPGRAASLPEAPAFGRWIVSRIVSSGQPAGEGAEPASRLGAGAPGRAARVAAVLAGVVVVAAGVAGAAWRECSALPLTGRGHRRGPDVDSGGDPADAGVADHGERDAGGMRGPTAVTGQGAGTLTWLPAAGRVIRQGGVLYRVDERRPGGACSTASSRRGGRWRRG